MDGIRYNNEDDHGGTDREMSEMEFNDVYEQLASGDRMIGNLHPCCELQMVTRLVIVDVVVTMSGRHALFDERSFNVCLTFRWCR